MTGRSHPKCWDEAKGAYWHECHVPSGNKCVENGCVNEGGTPWGPHFCPDHDVIRLDRVSAGFAAIKASMDAGNA